jgi:hypothetical protein
MMVGSHRMKVWLAHDCMMPGDAAAAAASKWLERRLFQCQWQCHWQPDKKMWLMQNCMMPFCCSSRSSSSSIRIK